ncbi:methyltransferase family protein [Rhizomicrobium electricum]|uniref:Isoprenylcysteine carboxylmethyltransferase family protein n=1 Tax=Rhizomicrobium electricum TaxID=480070 RepID=A0ABN1EWN3_9PROT|nr:isoprenylcysteine carboxylmethyltransferase family protein [Rhizomicrobium electricum]NIJ50000.1 protein-S-isoprenylcysteine O-methyltransferase Ste14 [Rhizomicrobium electricum]
MIAKLILQFAAITALLAGLLFGLAGTLAWTGAYVLCGSLLGGGAAMSVWLARRDPALLKERMGRGRRDKPAFDRILLPLSNLVLFGWIGAMGLDARWHGTAQCPLWLNLIGGVLVLLAFALVIRVMAENTFATAIVRAQPERGQHVISTGPYRFVRHPMYSAAVIAYAAIPLALGSRLGLLGIPLPILVLGVRVLFEEGLLRRELPGYCDYMARVRYRFVPFVW